MCSETHLSNGGDMTTTSATPRPFIPGMGVDWLLPLYDPLTRLLGFARTRQDLLLQAELRPRHRVLDIGCGTGALAVLAKRRFPDVDVVGLDPDPRALERARRKARRAAVHVRFDCGFADALDYPDASFDRVLSSFMFHHLPRAEKEATLRAVRRVLKPGGSLHLLDFVGGHGRLADNGEETVIELLNGSGLVAASKTAETTRLGFVRIAFYRAARRG
jgi:cyclopropane fatty-acyl-phospholipid synthase-like methyltransferase